MVDVAAYPSVANSLSVYLARQFSEKHPDISLQIHELPYSRTFNAIQEGLAHIAVAAENHSLIDVRHEMVKRGLMIEPLYEDRFYLIVSSGFRLADRDSIDVAEVLDERLAFTHVFPSFQDRTIGPLIRRFHTFAIFNNMETVKQAVAENCVIAVVPGIAMLGDHRLQSGALRQIPVTGFDASLTNYLLYEKYSMLSVVERAALSEIKAFYQELPDT